MNSPASSLAPPMGWNSYDCFGWAVTEAEVMANARYMRDHLLPFGWDTVVVDFIWSMAGASATPNPPQDENFSPRLRMDEYGRLLPDEGRFPSARNAKGFAGLAEAIHTMGLKFGIHIMRGIPRQAVSDDTPILNTPYHARDIANKNSTCIWLNHMYGLNMAAPGAQKYLDSLFALYAAWGVDYVKIDDLSQPYSAAEIEGYALAISRCGRPMIMSASPGETPLSQGAHISKYANLWRISADFWDNWPALKAQFKRMDDWTPYRLSGHFPDADMLPLGLICQRGPVGEARRTNFTPDEQKTLMNLWCIARSPLMLGGHLPANTPEDLALLTNKTAIAINQQSTGNCALRTTDDDAVWYAKFGNHHVLALFNLSDVRRCISIPAEDAFPDGVSSFTDIWTKETHAIDKNISFFLAPHASVMLISK